MNKEESQNIAKPANVQDKIKLFSKEKSKKIVAEIKKKTNTGKQPDISLLDTTMVLETVCERPKGLTEVRRDGKDNAAVIRVIKEEYRRCKEKNEMSDLQLTEHMRSFAAACWVRNLLNFSLHFLHIKYNHIFAL